MVSGLLIFVVPRSGQEPMGFLGYCKTEKRLGFGGCILGLSSKFTETPGRCSQVNDIVRYVSLTWVSSHQLVDCYVFWKGLGSEAADLQFCLRMPPQMCSWWFLDPFWPCYSTRIGLGKLCVCAFCETVVDRV